MDPFTTALYTLPHRCSVLWLARTPRCCQLATTLTFIVASKTSGGDGPGLACWSLGPLRNLARVFHILDSIKMEMRFTDLDLHRDGLISLSEFGCGECKSDTVSEEECVGWAERSSQWSHLLRWPLGSSSCTWPMVLISRQSPDGTGRSSLGWMRTPYPQRWLWCWRGEEEACCGGGTGCVDLSAWERYQGRPPTRSS